MHPKVCTVILNWNGRRDTLACLRSVSQLDYAESSILVVDNGSSDDSVAAVRDAFPRTVVIETGENLGYAGGNNVGLRHAESIGAEYALLLNNDTEVAPDCLSLLVSAAESDPHVAFAGPTVCYFDRPDVVWSAGGQVDWSRGTTAMMDLDSSVRDLEDTSPRPVDFLSGCAVLVRMAAINTVGMLDERFFAYYEDAEWCVRASGAGFTVLHVPEARALHKISPEARAASPLVHYYMTRNRLLFLRLARAPLRAWLHTLLVDNLRTLISWSVRPRWRERRPLRWVMVRGMADALRGQWGKALHPRLVVG